MRARKGRPSVVFHPTCDPDFHPGACFAGERLRPEHVCHPAHPGGACEECWFLRGFCIFEDEATRPAGAETFPASDFRAGLGGGAVL